MTALHHAVKQGDPGKALVLIAVDKILQRFNFHVKPIANIKDNDGNTPVNLLAQSGYMDGVTSRILSLLSSVEGIDLSIENNVGETAYDTALKHNQVIANQKEEGVLGQDTSWPPEWLESLNPDK